MLGLYEFKFLLGENETDYHQSAQKYTYCKYRLIKHTI